MSRQEDGRQGLSKDHAGVLLIIFLPTTMQLAFLLIFYFSLFEVIMTFLYLQDTSLHLFIFVTLLTSLRSKWGKVHSYLQALSMREADW